MNAKLKVLVNKLKDERSKKILFVAHCILNENTRYLGGAFCSGIDSNIFKELSTIDCGIVQLSCPEQIAWGGVLKNYIWLSIDTKGKLVNIVIRLIYPFFIWYTYLIYSQIVSKTIRIIQDYINSGLEIIGIVGIDGSPTCGVNANLSMWKSFQYISGLSINSLNRKDYNNNLYKTCLEQGNGIFIKLLSNKLKRKRINIKMFSFNLEDEMNRKKLKIGL